MTEGFDFTNYVHPSNGNNLLVGGNGPNYFYGGTDPLVLDPVTMKGGLSNDSYVITNAEDVIIAKPNHIAMDTIYSFISYELPDNVKKAFLVGTLWKTADQDLIGNNYGDYLNGNCGSNHIVGGSGNDTIFGGGYGRDFLEGLGGDDSLGASIRDCQIYGGTGNDTLIGSFGNDLLCGGSGSDVYKGFTKGSLSNTYGDFLGFGHDKIEDYMDYNSQVSANSGDSNKVDLSLFNKGELTFSAVDSNGDGNIDRLHIDAGQYGSIDIEKYFDNSSASIAGSHSGIGYIQDILLAGGVHLHFANIQQMATVSNYLGDFTILKGGNGADSLKASKLGVAYELYGGNGNDTLTTGTENDILCGGSGSDTYTGYSKTPDSKYMGWGHDIIRDYLNADGSIATKGSNDQDKLDLSKFSLGDLKFSIYDDNNDGHLDRLHIDAGKYGSIDIDKYFDDSSATVSGSHQGNGYIYDIVLANNQHLHFSDIQQMFGNTSSNTGNTGNTSGDPSNNSGSGTDPGNNPTDPGNNPSDPGNDPGNPSTGGNTPTPNVINGTDANNWISVTNTNTVVYAGAGKDTIYFSSDDTLCGGAGSDLYRNSSQTLGHDVIMDYMDNGQTAAIGKNDFDRLELTFKLGDLKFSAIDSDNDHYVDTLHIDAGQYGSIDIDKYFDNTSDSALTSHAGIGCIEDIMLAGNQHLYFADIQHMV